MAKMLSVISQRTYPGVGDIDECWLIATYIAARYSLPGCHLPTVTEARTAAHNPDMPGPTGGTLSDIMEVVTKYFPNFGVRKFVSTDWAMFVRFLDAGWVAAVGTLSSKLPSALQFGFGGEHEVTVQKVGSYFYLANPLAVTGAAPLRVTEAALKSAIFAFVGAGNIQAALFPDQERPMIYFKENKTGKFVVPANYTVNRRKLTTGGMVVAGTRTATTTPATFHFDYVLTRVGGDPDPALTTMLHGTDGYFAGYYISPTVVKETYDPGITETEVLALKQNVADLTALVAIGDAQIDAQTIQITELSTQVSELAAKVASLASARASLEAAGASIAQAIVALS